MIMTHRRRRGWRKSHSQAVALVTPPRVTAYVPRADCVTYGTGEYGNVVLMGDSVLDCEHYVGDGPDVAQRLFSMLGDRWKVSLLARDGATTKTLPYQTTKIPVDATALVVSIGGNDANSNSRILRDPNPYTMREALVELWWLGEIFALDYEEAVTPLLSLGLPVTVCTIYDCDFGPGEAEPIRAALAIFNDVILRFAFKYKLNVLDLRTVCTEPEDYYAIIEPSATGSAKIAEAISARMVPA